MQPHINSVEENINRQRRTIQNDVSSRVAAVEAEKKPYLDKISALESEKRNIIFELTKDR